MKGAIFEIVEQFICEKAGDEAYEEIIEKCNFITKEPFVSTGTYPDEDFMELFNKTVEHLNANPAEALRAVGAYSFPILAGKFPHFVEDFKDAKSFLKTVHSVIHVEVKKLFPHSKLPDFTYEDPSDNELVMNYSSERKLCPFAKGLIDGTAEYFKEKVDIQATRIKKDESEYKLELSFS